MNIVKALNGDQLTVNLEGRLDTISAPTLESSLDESLSAVMGLIFDMEKLVYLSSAGLRVILSSQKKMNAKKGKMIVRNVSETVMEIFEVTGFIDILTFE